MRIGIDLGGTKIEIIVLDHKGDEAFRQRIATPSGNYEATLHAIETLVDAAKTKLQLDKTIPVGIGTPGAISPITGLIKNSNSLCLIGKPLDIDLERRLKRKVRLANDANCFVLSEATDGAAQDAAVTFGVILGTGVGGGIVINGNVLTGAHAIAGEWGHNPLPWPTSAELPGKTCYCGKNGCIESFLSGPAIKSEFHSLTGKNLSATEIEALAETSKEAEDFLLVFDDRLARAFASVINILDPDVIVVGGGVSNLKRIYTNVPKLWARYVFSDAVHTKLVKAKFGDSSGVRGAAWLWPNT